MTTAETAAHGGYRAQPRPRSERITDAAGAFVSVAIEACRRWGRMHLAVVERNGLDNRILSDIGLGRSTLYTTAREAYGFKDRGHGGF
jgi:uncharacterized protein YjiS (DUF1127 family)